MAHKANLSCGPSYKNSRKTLRLAREGATGHLCGGGILVGQRTLLVKEDAMATTTFAIRPMISLCIIDLFY